MAPSPTTNVDLKAGKKFLFRGALIVSIVSSTFLTVILFAQAGFSLRDFWNFVDLSGPSIKICSISFLGFGFICLAILVLLIVGFFKIHRISTLIATLLSIFVSFGLIIFSFWLIFNLKSENFSNSIFKILNEELTLTKYKSSQTETNVENTELMSKLENQFRCCAVTNISQDYRPTNSNVAPQNQKLSPSTNNRKNEKTTMKFFLPISCCHENFRTEDNQCVDSSKQKNDFNDLYKTNPCSDVIIRHKTEQIKQQILTTIIGATSAVINSICLSAVIRLLGQVYQIEPLPN